MTLKFLCTAIAVAAAITMQSAHAGSADDDAERRKKICDQAEQRYQKLFGKPSAEEDVTIVKMYKYTFCPTEVEVKQGTTVRWVNVDRRTSHSVWLKEAGKEESDRLFSEEKVEMTFDMPPGDYPYLCGPHWKDEGMTGIVRVVE
jgi:plastocyanin